MDTILVARCLSGEPCRYHGRATPPRTKLLDRLARKYHIVFVCPEQLGGLPTPRPPARWHGDKLISGGEDVTGAFFRGASEALRIAERMKAVKFYGLNGSPSCDRDTGITAMMLSDHGVTVHRG
jgi:uncharacterized protein YbbK (DUF523 family)